MRTTAAKPQKTDRSRSFLGSERIGPVFQERPFATPTLKVDRAAQREESPRRQGESRPAQHEFAGIDLGGHGTTTTALQPMPAAMAFPIQRMSEYQRRTCGDNAGWWYHSTPQRTKVTKTVDQNPLWIYSWPPDADWGIPEETLEVHRHGDPPGAKEDMATTNDRINIRYPGEGSGLAMPQGLLPVFLRNVP